MAELVTGTWRQQQKVAIGDPSGSAEARRVSTRLAKEIGFSETETGHVAIVATELATNLIKHAKQGQMIIGASRHGQRLGIELLSLDQGPGIANIPMCMRDGYSTAGSLGTGLGAIARMADEFDIHSIQGKGTAVLATLCTAEQGRQPAPHIAFGISCLPIPGEEICGDGWAYETLADRTICMVADGLGHGPNAAIAAEQAVATAREHKMKNPAEIMEMIHGALRSTRGAALAIAQVRHADGLLRFCGVGNIAATLITDAAVRHLTSYNGTAGVEARKIVEFTYPWSAQSLLVMHSDGLQSRWDFKDYPGLTQRHPSLIAAILYRDFCRGRDDVTVLVGKVPAI